MNRQNVFASLLIACLLTVSSWAFSPMASAAPAKASVLNAESNVIKIKRRRHVPRTVFPIAPSYQAYDYPYYYSRGFYPTHIGRGYVYLGYHYRLDYSYKSDRPYKPKRANSPVRTNSCATLRQKCSANWGYKNLDYRACLKHYGC